jgi:acyl-CoA thioesterase
MTIARLTSDFLGPVPVGKSLHVETGIIKDGRKTQLASIEVKSEGRLVARATVLKTAHTQYAIPASLVPHPTVLPNHRSPVSMPGGFSGQFTIIPISGGFGHLKPSKVWIHLGSEILEGHEVDPVVRAIACADFANGLSMELPFQEWLFPTVDLSVSLTRAPLDEWILIDAKNEMTDTARAFCHARLSDSAGVFGHSLQTVLAQRRPRDASL